jgi:hypothetical protein
MFPEVTSHVTIGNKGGSEMENTSSLLFDNEKKIYYIYQSGKNTNSSRGFITAKEVYTQLSLGHLTLTDYVLLKSGSDWVRLMDLEPFSTLLPIRPSKTEAQNILKSESPALNPETILTDSFFLYVNKNQYGPLSIEELGAIARGGKLDDKSFVWKKGWKNWKSAAEIKGLSEYVKPHRPPEPVTTKTKTKTKSKTISKAVSERRVGPRLPLIAKIFVHNDAKIQVAVCRDLSVGGMQLLCSEVPGAVGEKIKLNVSPADDGKVSQLKPFVAEGQIVRVLEDGRGFSFRFTKLTEQAKSSIEAFLKKNP